MRPPGCMPAPHALSISSASPRLVRPAAIRAIQAQLLPHTLKLPSFTPACPGSLADAESASSPFSLGMTLEDFTDVLTSHLVRRPIQAVYARRPLYLSASLPSTRRSGQQMRLTQSAQQELLDLTVCDDEHQPAGLSPPRQVSSVAEPDEAGADPAQEHAVAIADQLAWQQKEVSEPTCMRMAWSNVHIGRVRSC